MDAKDKILAILSMTLVFVFAFWSGGKYEMYKLRKEFVELFDSFDTFLDDVDDIMDGDESSYDDTFSQIKF